MTNTDTVLSLAELSGMQSLSQIIPPLTQVYVIPESTAMLQKPKLTRRSSGTTGQRPTATRILNMLMLLIVLINF
jgi:hypothetical protein